MRHGIVGSLIALGLTASTLSAETRKVEGWNVGYEVPTGWRSGQRTGTAEMLVADDGSLLTIACGVDADANVAIRNLGQFLSSLQLTAVPSGEPKRTRIGDRDALVIDGLIYDKAMRAYGAHFVVLFDPSGTSVWVCGIAAAGKGEAVARDVDAIASGATIDAPTPNAQAIAALAGTWVVDTGSFSPGLGGRDSGTGTSHNERLAFDGQGRFEYTSTSAVYNPDMPVDIDPVTEQKDHGTYTVIGSAIVFRGTQGVLVLDMRLDGTTLVIGGKTYRR